MKKKLIAIVASLAMVATMVPSAAFATETPLKMDVQNVILKLPTEKELAGYDQTAYKAATKNFEMNEFLTASSDGSNLTLSGKIPYSTSLTDPAYAPPLKSGHFMLLDIGVEDPGKTDIAGWAMTYTSKERNGDKEFNCEKLYANSFEDLDHYSNMTIRLDGSSKSFTLYYLTTTGLAEMNRVTNTNSNTKFGDSSLADDPGNYAGTKAELEALMTIDRTDSNHYVVGKKTVRIVPGTDLTLMTEEATTKYAADISTVSADFSSAITALRSTTSPEAKLDKTDKVNDAYVKNTVVARAIYDNLTAAQKEIIADDETLKAEYDGLLEAEKNVASYKTISDAVALIAALPNATTLDVKDEASVQKIKDAEAAVKALRDGVQSVLLDTANGHLTVSQKENYDNCLAKISNADAQIVIDAIRALKQLPTTFTDKANVDEFNTPLVDAEKAYRALSESAKAAVTNYSVLTDYRADYNTLLKKYVDPLYAEAAKIDVEQPLSDESIALIRELQAYVDGRYVETSETAQIKDFDRDVYDALVAALEKTEDDTKSLANATITIAGADSIVYDGSKKTPDLTVTIGDKEVPADAYDKIYSDNKDAGEATVTIVPSDDSTYTGKNTATFTIKAAALTDAMVKNIANVTYTGKAIKPAISTASGVTYTVAYKNNTAVGKATATITGTGNYTGTITKNFIVKPAKETISSLKAGKKSLTVAYKAQTGAKYRIVYSPAKGQAKAVNTTATKKTIKSLKAGKTYKVKVRAYKVIDGTTYNGTYSTVKKVKVK